MRHGLKRPRLVLTPNGQPQLDAPCVGLLDQLFFAAASGSLTRTTPCLRVRITTPVSHGGEPVAVEAADPGGDGLGVPSSDLVGGRRVARAIRNGQERSGALDVRSGGAERAAQAGQLLALIRRERAKGIVPVARHGTPQSTRAASPSYQIPRQATRSYVRLQGFWAKQFSSGPCRSVRGDDIQLHGMGDGALRRRSIKLLYAGWLPHSVFRPGASPV